MTQAMQRDRRNAEVLIDVDEHLAGFVAADAHDRGTRVEELYHHYKPLAVRYAKHENAADCEGIANLALFDSFRALSNMRNANDHTFRRYLFRAIENYSRKEVRKPVPIPIEVDDQNIEPAGGFESDLVGSLHVGDLIDGLPEDQRAVMTHRFIHDRSADETGLILGKNPNAVYQLQHRATKRLLRILLTAAAALVVVGAAIAINRQANQQVIDSSPARPTTADADEQSVTSTSQPSTETTVGDQIQAGTIEQDERSDVTQLDQTETEPTALSSQSVEGTNPVAPAPDEVSDTTTTPEIASTTTEQVSTSTTSEQITTTTTTTSEQVTTTTTTASELVITTASAPNVHAQSVVAVNDVLELNIGEVVSFNVMDNDGPPSALGTVSWISGSVPGLTLNPDGTLTGSPTEARVAIIVYRLNGLNDSSDTGEVRITAG